MHVLCTCLGSDGSDKACVMSLSMSDLQALYIPVHEPKVSKTGQILLVKM